MAGSQTKFITDSKDESLTTGVAIPADVMNIVLEYDGCNTLQSHGNIPISTLFNTIETQRLRALLTAIVSGEPTKVQMILDIDASFVYKKLEQNQFVIAPSGHKFNLKPYQAALSVDDTQMAEMIKSYFIKLDDEKEAHKQFDEQYPVGWEKTEELKWKSILNQFDILSRAIRDSKQDDIISSGILNYIVTMKKGSQVEQELIEFWRLLDATLNEVITVGKRPFNPILYLKSLELYVKKSDYEVYFGGFSKNPRAIFYVQKVMGYEGIQRFMPVNYVQALRDGLYNTILKLQNKQPQGRSTIFEIECSNCYELFDFYPLEVRGSPGFNFVAYGSRLLRLWLGDASMLRYFKNVCDQKYADLQCLRHGGESIDPSRQARFVK